MSWLWVIVIFSALVLVHELGHFLAARRGGVEVEEFGLGFPPRLFSCRIGATRYSLNLLPLGGFVKLKGEDGQDISPGSFGAASWRVKVRVLLAGVVMNLVLAFAILTGLALTGLPPIIEGQFSFGEHSYARPPRVLAALVQPGSPAEQAGIKRGDIILSAAGQSLDQPEQLVEFTRAAAGQRVSLTVERGGQQRQVEVKLRPATSKEGFLGVTPFLSYELRYGWQAPLVAAGILVQLVWGTLAAFGGLIAGLLVRGEVSEAVTGPVGIAVLLGSIRELGVSYLAVFVAAISVSLAVLNSLPLPALDGGRLALLGAQRVLGRPLSARAEAIIHSIGFALLLALMAVVTYFDLKRLG